MQRAILRMEVPKTTQISAAKPEELILPPVLESMYIIHNAIYTYNGMVYTYMYRSRDFYFIHVYRYIARKLTKVCDFHQEYNTLPFH